MITVSKFRGLRLRLRVWRWLHPALYWQGVYEQREALRYNAETGTFWQKGEVGHRYLTEMYRSGYFKGSTELARQIMEKVDLAALDRVQRFVARQSNSNSGHAAALSAVVLRLKTIQTIAKESK